MILTPLVREAFNYPPPKVKHSTTPLIFRASLCLGRPSRVVEERLTSWSFWMNPCSLCKGWSPPRYPKSTRCWIEDPPIQRSCLQMVGRPRGIQQPLPIIPTDLNHWVGHHVCQEIFTCQISWPTGPGNTTTQGKST